MVSSRRLKFRSKTQFLKLARTESSVEEAYSAFVGKSPSGSSQESSVICFKQRHVSSARSLETKELCTSKCYYLHTVWLHQLHTQLQVFQSGVQMPAHEVAGTQNNSRLNPLWKSSLQCLTSDPTYFTQFRLHPISKSDSPPPPQFGCVKRNLFLYVNLVSLTGCL